MACFWVCSRPQRKKPISDSVENVQKKELLGSVVSGEEEFSSDSSKGSSANGNRVMVVVDWSVEAEGALEWTLSHAVRSHDTIVLVHVLKSLKPQGENFRDLCFWVEMEHGSDCFCFFFLQVLSSGIR